MLWGEGERRDVSSVRQLWLSVENLLCPRKGEEGGLLEERRGRWHARGNILLCQSSAERDGVPLLGMRRITIKSIVLVPSSR